MTEDELGLGQTSKTHFGEGDCRAFLARRRQRAPARSQSWRWAEGGSGGPAGLPPAPLLPYGPGTALAPAEPPPRGAPYTRRLPTCPQRRLARSAGKDGALREQRRQGRRLLAAGTARGGSPCPWRRRGICTSLRGDRSTCQTSLHPPGDAHFSTHISTEETCKPLN